MPRAGWAKRQAENTKRNIAAWPRWQKLASGAAQENIYIVHSIHRAGHPEVDIAIIAFDDKEAREKVVGLLTSRYGGPQWVTQDARGLMDICGRVAITRAAYVLQQAGIMVYEIVQEGKEERLRVCEAAERIKADSRFDLNAMGPVVRK